jgi:hypothetical protein
MPVVGTAQENDEGDCRDRSMIPAATFDLSPHSVGGANPFALIRIP